LFDFGLAASESEGSVALRYSAASKREPRNGASAGSETWADLGVVFCSDTAMARARAGLRKTGAAAAVPESVKPNARDL